MKNNKIRALSPVLLSILVMFSACSRPDAPATAETGAAADVAPPGKLDERVSPSHYRLELRIDPREERFSGTGSIDVKIAEATDSIWLHGKDLDVSEVYLTGANGAQIAASYEQQLDSGVALVTLEDTAAAGSATLHFSWNAAFNTSTNALFRVERDGKAYAASQFEPIAARNVFPGFDDPGFKVPFDLSLVTREGDAAITTTPEASSESLGDGFVRHVYVTTRPMPAYLLAFAVGPYDVVDYGTMPPNAVRERGIPLRGVAASGLGERMQYALKHTDGILSVLEEYFGTPYPYRKLDLIAMPESFGGAMENIGAITYDEFLLLMDEDSPIEQRRTYTVVHAHEMAHMWFGDLVTPKWWNDIWLNESFASWMMNKAADRYWPEGEFERSTLQGALGAMSNDSLAAARQIREPIDANEQIEGAFDGITYQKGAGVLQMLERYVGEDDFRAGIRLHMQRHADAGATAEDFIASIAEGSDRSEVEQAFKSYIEQPGVPLLSVDLNCDDPANPQLDVRQARYAPLGSSIDPAASRWYVPMCVSYRVGDERKSSCELLKDASQSIPLDADRCPTEVHPNADGAGYYRFTMDSDGWMKLIDDVAELPAAEALVLGDSLDAAFRAGMVDADIYLSGMAALIGQGAWDVADAATNHLEGITEIIDPQDLAVVEAAFRNIAGPRFAALGDARDTGSALLHDRMLRFMIVMAREQTLRAPLAGQAAARIGLEGEADPDAAPASELETIFSVGVQDLGAPFFDRLLDATLTTEDPQFRQAAVGALARVEDPALVSRLQEAVMADRFQGTDAARIVFRQMFRSATTELTYAWIRANQDAIIDRVPESFRSSMIPALGGSFCSVERAGEWEDFVRAIGARIPGYELSLSQTVESIRLCAGLKEAKAAELLTAFRHYQ